MITVAELLTVTVSQLNNYIKRVMDNNGYLAQIWVKGEISNFKNHYSGHLYLTLKDEASALRAVMFKSAAAGLQFAPENGMKVLARGRVGVYERDGQYQLYIEELQPDGVGALHIAFEQLKARLTEEGLFDEQHKKPLPRYPERIAVVTAKTGAAVRDIIHVLSRRYPLAEVYVCPVLVQGDQAAAQISAAINWINERELADVIIAGRGGGSIEDLWAFNEEQVARSVFASHIPIISAVGHEVDFTIADFVADVRAPTPSAAAEIAVPDAGELRIRLADIRARLMFLMDKQIEGYSVKLKRLSQSNALRQFGNRLYDRQLMLNDITDDMERAIKLQIKGKQDSLAALSGKLDALSPLHVLSRGYAIAKQENGQVIRSIKDVTADDTLDVQLQDGTLACKVIDVNT